MLYLHPYISLGTSKESSDTHKIEDLDPRLRAMVLLKIEKSLKNVEDPRLKAMKLLNMEESLNDSEWQSALKSGIQVCILSLSSSSLS
jgi:hypothetical protein